MRRKSIRIFAGLFVTAALCGNTPQTSAADLDKLAQEISETTMSPFCPGRTISSCPSPQARELRGQIHTWLNSGYSPDAVRNQLFTIYGEDVRGTPESEGFGLVGWFAPAVFVILSLAIIFRKLGRMKRKTEEHLSTPDAAVEARVAAALKERMS